MAGRKRKNRGASQARPKKEVEEETVVIQDSSPEGSPTQEPKSEQPKASVMVEPVESRVFVSFASSF